MNKETLKRIFDFLEEKGEHRGPLFWKHKNNIPLTYEELNIEGNLDLSDTNITSLPKGLKVGGNLELTGITLGEDYDDDGLRQMIRPGFINGEIFR